MIEGCAPVLKVLGIETSCDETAAAVVTDDRAILSDIVLSQLDEHRAFGGIVPEVAARAHLEAIDGLVERALAEAGVGLDELSAVAATGGPGLIGGVIVGVMTGKAIAAARDLPFIAVNHLEGHALTARLTHALEFPYLLLLVSGGHCQLLVVEGVGRYRRLGTTVDDAVGEAFDKAAKLLGLGYPGGPAVERAAARAAAAGRDGAAERRRFDLPRPMVGKPGCDFSFSGLKTALRQRIAACGDLEENERDALAAAFQHAVVESLVDRTERAMRQVSQGPSERPVKALVVAGGVAANSALRGTLEAAAARNGFSLVAPPQRLCTDNAAMIAWAGVERLRLGLTDGLDFAPRPRWPLDPTAPKARGAGVKA
jgi:N6-L-threonylcarbamoyladenine synthase